jgi:hypothetical protein
MFLFTAVEEDMLAGITRTKERLTETDRFSYSPSADYTVFNVERNKTGKESSLRLYNRLRPRFLLTGIDISTLDIHFIYEGTFPSSAPFAFIFSLYVGPIMVRRSLRGFVPLLLLSKVMTVLLIFDPFVGVYRKHQITECRPEILPIGRSNDP